MEKQLKSKLKPFYVILIYILSVPLSAAGVGISWRIISSLRGDIPIEGETWFAAVLFLTLFVLVRYLLLRAFPVVIISREGVQLKRIFSTVLYRWEDVHNVKLTGKGIQRISGTPFEAITIQLHDLTLVNIWVDMYENISPMRIVLQHAMKLAASPGGSMNDLDVNVEEKAATPSVLPFEAGKTYKGNHLLTIAGITSYIFIGVMLFYIRVATMSIAPLDYLIMLLVSGLLALAYWSMAMQLNYFELTPHYLIVRNQLFWWQRTIYVLADIRELVIEAPPKRATTLRVISNDFKDKMYGGDSLRANTWRQFITTLRDRGLTVRDEVF